MLTAEDLLAPKGRIEGKSLFPDLSSTDLAVRLQEYLTQGYLRATSDDIAALEQDAAVAHYAYHRAYLAVYQHMIANPISSTTTEGGSASFLLEQARAFRDMAADELAEYGTFIVVDVDTAARASQTVALPNVYNW